MTTTSGGPAKTLQKTTAGAWRGGTDALAGPKETAGRGLYWSKDTSD
jgi:hypothetical protein